MAICRFSMIGDRDPLRIVVVFLPRISSIIFALSELEDSASEADGGECTVRMNFTAYIYCQMCKMKHKCGLQLLDTLFGLFLFNRHFSCIFLTIDSSNLWI